MAPSRRVSNGRSPLVNKQSQITSFFSTGRNKQNPNSPTSSPDPSPLSKPSQKPPLIIGHTPNPTSKRKEPSAAIPDDEHEAVDLKNDEAVGLHHEETPRSSRRLRRKVYIEEDGDSGDDSTGDEDWGKSSGKKLDEDDSSEDVELEDEEEEQQEEEEQVRRPKRSSKASAEPRKRGKTVGTDSDRKSKVDDSARKKAMPREVNSEGAHGIKGDNLLNGEADERFGKREAEKFPFLLEGRKDAKGRRPGNANYDSKTLYLPPDFLKSLSGGQRQWWEFKANHMDKILFFKMGKFYELFEMDAHVGAKELDLQYMKGDQPHCGFPEKNFSTNLEKLAKKGYRVLVIEQTETPEQLEIRRKEMGSKDKVVKREICAVVTKGTLVEGEQLSTNPDSSYLMSLTENCATTENPGFIMVGVCVVDVSTSKFMVGQFEDDLERHHLCSILAELRPVEIIKPYKMLSVETERAILRHTRSPLINELAPSSEFWDADKTIVEIGNIYRSQHSKEFSASHVGSCTESKRDMINLPDVLSDLIRSGHNGSYAISAFGGCLFYLKQALLDETLLRCAKFEPIPCSNIHDTLQKQYMILDAAALENLEILENNKNGGHSGTLFSRLDHCVTAFGKRLLRSWLVRPLYDAASIIDRQNAIMGLKGNSSASVLQFRKELSRLPDMEWLLARLFASCDSNGRNSSRVILYEDAAKKQLKDFIAALHGCQLMVQACVSLSSILSSSTSSILHHLLTPGKGLPEISSILRHFKDAFDWSEAEQSGRIIPREGADIEYDSACKSVKEIEMQLKQYLKEQRVRLKDSSVNYVSVGKDSYLLEVPEHLRDSIPRDYELQSSKKGYFRYWTPQIKKLLSEISQAESEKDSKLKSILVRLMERFSEHHIKWRQLISVTAEIDVLISLAITSEFYEGPCCRPNIKGGPFSDEITPTLSCKNLGHPLLRSDALSSGSFVPNDINIGGVGGASFILLTGPNMGGKSTLLRQVCLAVILAQIGADVPAQSFELSPVDRIFVRMGARDHIMTGQSTFLTELSETAYMLSSATCLSLVALDELGRGTSTSDGQAIAESVLEYFIRSVRCRGLFSTHYHRLSVDFENDPKVLLCHMACQVGKGSAGVEEVTFLYKLTSGSCPKSYGVNVARLAGLPASVLLKAAAKSTEFETSYGRNKRTTESELVDIITGMKEILQATKDCRMQSHFTSLEWLTGLQSRARSLVEEI